MTIFIVDEYVCNLCPLFLIVWAIQCPEMEKNVDPCFQKPQIMSSFCPQPKYSNFTVLEE